MAARPAASRPLRLGETEHLRAPADDVLLLGFCGLLARLDAQYRVSVSEPGMRRNGLGGIVDHEDAAVLDLALGELLPVARSPSVSAGCGWRTALSKEGWDVFRPKRVRTAWWGAGFSG